MPVRPAGSHRPRIGAGRARHLQGSVGGRGAQAVARPPRIHRIGGGTGTAAEPAIHPRQSQQAQRQTRSRTFQAPCPLQQVLQLPGQGVPPSRASVSRSGRLCRSRGALYAPLQALLQRVPGRFCRTACTCCTWLCSVAASFSTDLRSSIH